MTTRPRIAIVGTGIAGLGCAHFLHPHADLTLYEAEADYGGHSNTVLVEEDGRSLPVDTGFMVFNHQTYPNLCRLFRELGVETQRTDMSFSLAHLPTGYEWNGASLDKIFGQRRNLLSPRFWRFLLKIHRFNRETAAALEDPRYAGMSLREYAEARGYGRDFLDLYILPMGSAVWSTPPERMLDFPARTLMRFWYNHGFLGMETRHPWWTVTGGSRQYVRKIAAPFADRIRLSTPVERIERAGGKVRLQARGQAPETYDKVILATHAPTSLRLLADPTPLEQELLPAFRYQPNLATLHTDERFMPRERRCWASWNYRIQVSPQGVLEPSTHYWMNSLQGVSRKRNYFVSINAPAGLDESKVVCRIPYEHPLFDVGAVALQPRLAELNRLAPDQTTYYCGAWFRYGFHEDGLLSAVQLCHDLLGRDPW